MKPISNSDGGWVAIQRVAEEAGVSPSTKSRVLSPYHQKIIAGLNWVSLLSGKPAGLRQKEVMKVQPSAQGWLCELPYHLIPIS